jgi:hypothetical protein
MVDFRFQQVHLVDSATESWHAVRYGDIALTSKAIRSVKFRVDGGLVQNTSNFEPFDANGIFQDAKAYDDGQIVAATLRTTAPWTAGSLTMGIVINGSRVVAATDLDLAIEEWGDAGKEVFFDSALDQVRTGDAGITVTFDHTTETVTATGAHGLVDDDPLFFSTGGSLPAELAAGDTYYAINVSGLDFQVSDVPAGAVIAFTDNGAGTNRVHSTFTAHGLQDNDLIRFGTTGSLPAELSADTDYYVIYVDDYAFQVELTIGGGAIDFTDDGAATNTVYEEFPRDFDFAVSSDAAYDLAEGDSFNPILDTDASWEPQGATIECELFVRILD